MEKDAMVEKTAGVVENAGVSRWPERGRVAAVTLERGGERGRRSVGHDGEHRDDVVTLEHDAAVRMRRCGEWRGPDHGLTSGYGWIQVDKRMYK
jgi:hypothetical protein